MNDTGQTIGLFGGSFNPPHLAHVLVAAWTLAGGEVDEVWAIPTGGHPFGKPLAPFADRMAMCRLAFACFGQRIRLLNVEREARIHYSIDTVQELARRHPERRWRWIMGSDTLADAPKWRQFDDLLRLAPPLVIPRQGYSGKGAEACGVEIGAGVGTEAGGTGADAEAGGVSAFALPDISSTHIRQCLADGQIAALRDLLPGLVLRYIVDHRLYDVPADTII